MYREAAENADLIVTSGGVSAGAFDVVKELGTKAGFNFAKVRMQPGKPQGNGAIDFDGRYVKVSYPATLYRSMFHSFCSSARSSHSGRGRMDLQGVPAIAGADWKSSKGRRQYAPMVAKYDEGELTVYPTHEQSSGSHLIATLHRATGLVVVPEDIAEVAKGDRVEYFPL